MGASQEDSTYRHEIISDNNPGEETKLTRFIIEVDMVFYFKTRCGGYTIYMGKDKYENEDLIKYGLESDVWFHVDDLSSAHVYLRLKPGETMDDISEAALLDCASLVKANSIAGCKVCFFSFHPLRTSSH